MGRATGEEVGAGLVGVGENFVGVGSGAGTLLSLFGLLPMGSQFREEEAIPKVGITTVGARVAKAVGK